MAGAVAAWWCLRRERRVGMIASFAVAGILYLGLLAAGGGAALEAQKAPRLLVQSVPAGLTEHEVRVACYEYFQPSLVFYCRRQVQRLNNDSDAIHFFDYPLPVYLFVPLTRWEMLEGQVRGPHRLLGCQRDLYQNCEVVLVTNR
jgi:hypothetical protein